MKIYTPFGAKAGILISLEDAKYRPLSQCRSEMCHIGDNGNLSVWSFKVDGDTINLPYNKYREVLEQEKDKEIGIDLLKRLKIYPTNI